MTLEALLLLVGTFLVLAIGFWRAAERPKDTGSDLGASASELHKV
jgi:hypothetical protein